MANTHNLHLDYAKNRICLWYENDAQGAAKFYADTFPNSHAGKITYAPSDFPDGRAGQILTVYFTVCGVECFGINGGDHFKASEAFSFSITTEDQEETDRYWNAIIDNGGSASACGWCKDKWGISWQITPRIMTDTLNQGGDVAQRAFKAMMDMGKIDIATIKAAIEG